MIVRSYTGRTVPEALEKVRNDLGEGALIIETRAIREPGLLGRKTGYEVVAAHDDGVPAAAPRGQAPRAPAEPTVQPWQAADLGTGHQAASLARETGRGQPPADDLRSGLEEELAAIRRQLARLASGQGTPIGHLGEELAAQLDEAELPNDIVAELDSALARAGDRLEAAKRRDFLTLLLARALPCAGAIDWRQCRRLMMVGPTGVGKTTTIAKLAGELVLKQQRRVALVTIDTYRVGATDQLRAFADLLDVPLEVATTPAQLGATLRKYESFDNVLIDTAGRSPADATRVNELKSFCRAAPGIAVMLAAAATSGRAEFAAVVERFSILPLEHAVITKLDECVAAGRLYGCLRRHRLPVNYLTTGQEVPDDIVPAVAELIPSKVIGARVPVGV
jgi:flagellar biosynthesis protein FlhF